jgi:pimeloyl-ACP methyl ester carboxylesterase
LALYDAWVYEEQLPSFFYWARTPGVGEALVAMFYRERTEDKLARAFYSPAYVTEAVVDDVDGLLARPGALAAILEAIRGQRFEEVQGRYREVDKPVLLLWGREDQISTMAVGERLSRDLPQARMIVYPRCGHFPMVEAREVSTQDVAAFLAEEAP